MAQLLNAPSISSNNIALTRFPMPPRTGSSRYQYPSDLVYGERDFYIQIEFVSYERRSVFAQPFLRPIGGITLPIPQKLNDVQTVVWEAVEGGATTGALENLKAGGAGGVGGAAAAAAIAGGVNYGGSIIGGAVAARYGAGAGILAGIGANQGINLAGQALGLALNPFLTMLFKSPAFKEHQLVWSFAPNSAADSQTLNSIINYFRFNMQPSMLGNTGGALLRYPNIALIRLNATSGGDNFLYKFKPCAVAAIAADRTGGGGPAFHKDGSPAIVNVAVHFKEIEYWLQEDIGTML